MEYLMTYGWALLVIVIVIAVLLWINPFKAPEQCIFDQAGFVCSRPVLVQNSTIFADITNGNQKSIVVVGVACVKGRSPLPGEVDKWPTGFLAGTVNSTNKKTVEYQGIFNLGQNSTDTGTMATTCRDNAGVKVQLKQNEDFNGRLYIAYRFSDDSDFVPAKIVGANLVTKVQ
jgi:hypothetical protein